MKILCLLLFALSICKVYANNCQVLSERYSFVFPEIQIKEVVPNQQVKTDIFRAMNFFNSIESIDVKSLQEKDKIELVSAIVKARRILVDFIKKNRANEISKCIDQIKTSVVHSFYTEDYLLESVLKSATGRPYEYFESTPKELNSSSNRYPMPFGSEKISGLVESQRNIKLKGLDEINIPFSSLGNYKDSDSFQESQVLDLQSGDFLLTSSADFFAGVFTQQFNVPNVFNNLQIIEKAGEHKYFSFNCKLFDKCSKRTLGETFRDGVNKVIILRPKTNVNFDNKVLVQTLNKIFSGATPEYSYYDLDQNENKLNPTKLFRLYELEHEYPPNHSLLNTNSLSISNKLSDTLGLKKVGALDEILFDNRFEIIAYWNDPRTSRGLRYHSLIMRHLYELSAFKKYKLRNYFLRDLIPYFSKKYLKKNDFSKTVPRNMIETFIPLKKIHNRLLTKIYEIDVKGDLSPLELNRKLKSIIEEDRKLYLEGKKKKSFHRFFRPTKRSLKKMK